MSNNKQQTAVEFYLDKVFDIIGDAILDKLSIEQINKIHDLSKQAKEMYNDKIEAATIIAAAERATQKASQNCEFYYIGYSHGYTRALQLIQWQIENQLKTETK